MHYIIWPSDQNVRRRHPPRYQRAGVRPAPHGYYRGFESPPPHHTYFIRNIYLRETYGMESMSVLGKADHSYQACYGTIRLAQSEPTAHLRYCAKWEKNSDESDEVVRLETNKVRQHRCYLCRIPRPLQGNHDNQGRNAS